MQEKTLAMRGRFGWECAIPAWLFEGLGVFGGAAGQQEAAELMQAWNFIERSGDTGVVRAAIR